MKSWELDERTLAQWERNWLNPDWDPVWGYGPILPGEDAEPEE